MKNDYEIYDGLPYPLGANYDGNGVNFALFSAHAERVQVCLFNPKGLGEVRIDLPQYTDEVFHGYIKGLKPGQLYGYRVYGPYEPEKGHRFNPNKLLVDPYAKMLTIPFIGDNAMLGYRPDSPLLDLSYSRKNSAACVPKCIVTDDNDYVWSQLKKPKTPWNTEIIYETHLKGFTARNPEVDAILRGTFAGMATPAVVQYLKGLGISAVELLPTAAFMTNGFLLDKNLTNYWGYDPICFMAPHALYFAERRLAEMKHMVQVFHEAGIEVILDVVYNHTGEGNQFGQTLCYRGIDNASYYRLNKENPRYYDDTTGCGNSFNLGHPRALQLVMDSLRYWTEVMRIDGFRFDLATTLARDDNNQYTVNSDFLTTVQQDPVLQRQKLIAEPWDLGMEGYQVGAFRPGWAEWNDKFRNTVRRFWRGDEGQAADLAGRITASSDLYDKRGRKPWESVNFITAHDGFSLWDLVSYNYKHNEANDENNKDGVDTNFSWNNGVEGETKDEAILAIRERRARALMATLLLSCGTPMIQGGDEVLRTAFGNNNTYAQDNIYSWINWPDTTAAGWRMQTLVKRLIQIRHTYAVFESTQFQTDESLIWYRPDGTPMQPDDWHYYVRAISCLIKGREKDLFMIFNGFDKPLDWQLPEGLWRLVLDTTDEAKFIKSAGQAPAWGVLLFERNTNGKM